MAGVVGIGITVAVGGHLRDTATAIRADQAVQVVVVKGLGINELGKLRFDPSFELTDVAHLVKEVMVYPD